MSVDIHDCHLVHTPFTDVVRAQLFCVDQNATDDELLMAATAIMTAVDDHPFIVKTSTNLDMVDVVLQSLTAKCVLHVHASAMDPVESN